MSQPPQNPQPNNHPYYQSAQSSSPQQGNSSYPQQANNQYAAPSAGQGEPSKKGRTLLIGIVDGLVLALIIGAGLYFTGVIKFGSTSSVDTTAISLPDSVNGLKPANAVAAELSSGTDNSVLADFNDLAETQLTQTISQAYGGAAATIRFYSDSDLEYRPTVMAVRASSPDLFLPQATGPVALERLKLAELPREIISSGEVQCEVYRVKTTPEGGEIDPANTVVGACQRTNEGLTVRAYGSGGSELNSVEVNVALVNSIWDSVSAG